MKTDEKWIVLSACHNRVSKTLEALSLAKAALEKAELSFHFVVFDDGSTDNTSNEVKKLLEEKVTVLNGDGSNYWAKSMSSAEQFALGNFKNIENIVWLNDDSMLFEDSFVKIKAFQLEHPDSIIVGSMRDSNFRTSYGGLIRSGIHPLSYRMIDPGELQVTRIDSFNGNFLVVPIDIAIRLEQIEGRYTHAFADIDYGVRANKLEIPILLAPGFFGECERNAATPKENLLRSWSRFTSVKGGGNYTNLKLVLKLSNPRSWWFWIFTTRVSWFLKQLLRVGN